MDWETQMDILEELKARDERIERLERALLLVLGLSIGNHLVSLLRIVLAIFKLLQSSKWKPLLLTVKARRKSSKICLLPVKGFSC